MRFFIGLSLLLAFSLPNSGFAAKRPFKKVLSFEKMMKLPEKSRARYYTNFVRAVAALESLQQAKEYKVAALDSSLFYRFLIESAFAAEKPHCIFGGVIQNWVRLRSRKTKKMHYFCQPPKVTYSNGGAAVCGNSSAANYKQKMARCNPALFLAHFNNGDDICVRRKPLDNPDRGNKNLPISKRGMTYRCIHALSELLGVDGTDQNSLENYFNKKLKDLETSRDNKALNELKDEYNALRKAFVDAGVKKNLVKACGPNLDTPIFTAGKQKEECMALKRFDFSIKFPEKYDNQPPVVDPKPEPKPEPIPCSKETEGSKDPLACIQCEAGRDAEKGFGDKSNWIKFLAAGVQKYDSEARYQKTMNKEAKDRFQNAVLDRLAATGSCKNHEFPIKQLSLEVESFINGSSTESLNDRALARAFGIESPYRKGDEGDLFEQFSKFKKIGQMSFDERRQTFLQRLNSNGFGKSSSKSQWFRNPKNPKGRLPFRDNFTHIPESGFKQCALAIKGTTEVRKATTGCKKSSAFDHILYGRIRYSNKAKDIKLKETLYDPSAVDITIDPRSGLNAPSLNQDSLKPENEPELAFARRVRVNCGISAPQKNHEFFCKQTSTDYTGNSDEGHNSGEPGGGEEGSR